MGQSESFSIDQPYNSVEHSAVRIQISRLIGLSCMAAGLDACATPQEESKTPVDVPISFVSCDPGSKDLAPDTVLSQQVGENHEELQVDLEGHYMKKGGVYVSPYYDSIDWNGTSGTVTLNGKESCIFNLDGELAHFKQPCCAGDWVQKLRDHDKYVAADLVCNVPHGMAFDDIELGNLGDGFARLGNDHYIVSLSRARVSQAYEAVKDLTPPNVSFNLVNFAVRDVKGWAHFDLDHFGPMYSARFEDVTGAFYATLNNPSRYAGARLNGQWFHIGIDGKPLYDRRFSGVGSFYDDYLNPADSCGAVAENGQCFFVDITGNRHTKYTQTMPQASDGSCGAPFNVK